MKTYKIKPTKKQLAIIKEYWDKFKVEESIFWKRVMYLEQLMSEETDIEGLEFFYADNECVGVGNVSRSMKLIQFD